MNLDHQPASAAPIEPRPSSGTAPSVASETPAVGQTFSVVVPFYNEADNVRFVLEELRTVLPAAEIIAVDDGSTDSTWQQILQLPGIRGLRLERNLGQSAAIYHGLRACTRELCGLMDGDGQNDPANFRLLLAAFNEGQTDVVCGYRADRHDSWNRRAAARVANTIRRFFLDDGVRDTGCSQKVFRREAFELLVPFRGVHRYLPALFKKAGLRVVETPVRHRTRRAGKSKYNNWTRAIAGIYDLIGVTWLLKRRLPPVRIEEKR